MWSTPIDLYCERLVPSFWAEPVNALTNVAFFVAAWAAFRLWRRNGNGDRAILALILVVVAVGLGSFAFYTLATRGAMLLDVGPIGVFIFSYVLLALRRFLALSWPLALGLFAGFIALTLGLAVGVPRPILDGSAGYFPALAMLFAIGWPRRDRVQGRALLVAGVLFAASIALRIGDLPLCGAFPLGTHFLWHILNAAVIYAVLYGAIGERQERYSMPAAAC